LTAFWFGSGSSSRLFGWYDVPAEPPRGAVLLCNPIGDDSVRAHRPMRHLAATLLKRGFAVLRFDYDGTGDSAGDERAPDRVETWIGDIELAAAELRRRSGASSVAAVGVRLGATLALAAAGAGFDRVVAWGGYARGVAFTKASAQFYKLHKRIEPKGFAGGPASRPEGEEVFGFLLTRATIAELEALDLRTRPPPRALTRALVVGDGSGRPEQEALEGHLRELGATTETKNIPGSLQYLIEIPHKSKLPEAALDAITTWLADTAPEATPPPSREREVELDEPTGPDGERAVRFGEGGRLFGILHAPGATGAPEQRQEPLPPILLASAGTVHRIGPHRFYVGLARRWAKLGFPVLRVDLSGIGDTPAGDDGVENVTYPRTGYEDLESAIDELLSRTRTGTASKKVIVAGLCSGGDFAFQMSLRDPRVTGALILNPRTFCVNDLAKVETGNFESVVAAAAQARVQGEVVPVPESLRAIVERGVETLLVVSEEDPGVHYVDVHWGDAMSSLRELRGFRREDVPGSDHNFTSLWSQETVSDLVAAHLTERYLA
jgi:alpha-beta hydrolase superfamily lysophospholipase